LGATTAAALADRRVAHGVGLFEGDVGVDRERPRHVGAERPHHPRIQLERGQRADELVVELEVGLARAVAELRKARLREDGHGRDQVRMDRVAGQA
jgi:hypothetical protein